MPPASKDRSPAFTVDRYEVFEALGRGGFGAVYRARHAHLDRQVALKLLREDLAEDEEMLERFFREARAAASVGSPHIVKVLDCGVDEHGQPFLAMEILEGEGLDETLRTEAPLGEERAVGIVLQILDGLSAAHGAGIVHRDLKPANVFLTRDSETGEEVVKLLDFGVSKVQQGALDKALTRTGAWLGTPQYMAPEQFAGARDVDHRADLYAVAVVLFQLLSGQLPLEAATPAELVYRVTSEPARPLSRCAPSTSAALAMVVDRGLARDPEARWTDTAAFSAALRNALGTGGAALTPGWTEQRTAGPAEMVALDLTATVGKGGVAADSRPDGALEDLQPLKSLPPDAGEADAPQARRMGGGLARQGGSYAGDTGKPAQPSSAAASATAAPPPTGLAAGSPRGAPPATPPPPGLRPTSPASGGGVFLGEVDGDSISTASVGGERSGGYPSSPPRTLLVVAVVAGVVLLGGGLAAGVAIATCARPQQVPPVASAVSPAPQPLPLPTPAPPPAFEPAEPGAPALAAAPAAPTASYPFPAPAAPTPTAPAPTAPSPTAPSPTTPAPPPELAATPAAETPAAPVRTSGLRVLGQLDEASIQQLIARARPRMSRCRPQGAAVQVRVQAHVVPAEMPGGPISLAGPAPGAPGPREVARCCGSALRGAVTEGWNPGQSGIFSFDVALAGR